MNILREFILCGWRQFVLFRQKNKSVSTWLTVSSVKHQPEGACSTEEIERKEGRKETIQILLFPSSIFSIVLQREGKQDVWKQRMRSGYSQLFHFCSFSLNWRKQTFVIFYWKRFFSGNVILRIDKYPQNQFTYIVWCQFLFLFIFFSCKEVFSKTIYIVFILEIFFQLLFKARSWMKFISQWDTF